MDAVIPNKGRVKVYACGGAAINIASLLAQTDNDPSLVAEFDIAGIDTSKANLIGKDKLFETYLIDGKDGSGKVRRENSGPIANALLDIIQKHKPADLNIVLSSGGGGSGSVIAPLLARELLKKNLPVVVLLVGSVASKLEATNTLATLKSYEAAAKAAEAPVVMQYAELGTRCGRQYIDNELIATMVYLATLYSRQNKELDSRDLHNWLRYSDNGVTSFPPRLVTLSLFVDGGYSDDERSDIQSAVGTVISVATLAPENVSTTLPFIPEYQTTGILPSLGPTDGKPHALTNKIINYVIADGPLKKAFKDLDAVVGELKASSTARRHDSGILSDADQVDDTGLVFE